MTLSTAIAWFIQAYCGALVSNREPFFIQDLPVGTIIWNPAFECRLIKMATSDGDNTSLTGIIRYTQFPTGEFNSTLKVVRGTSSGTRGENCVSAWSTIDKLNPILMPSTYFHHYFLSNRRRLYSLEPLKMLFKLPCVIEINTGFVCLFNVGCNWHIVIINSITCTYSKIF